MDKVNEALRALAERAIPFLRDEADKYEDDGSNEPLELAREIESLLASSPSDESALPSANLAFDGGAEAAHPSRGVVDDEAAHDDIITLSDVSGVLGEIAEQFDGGEYHVSEETRRVLIDFAHGITDHPLFSIVGRHFVQSRSAWLIEHRNCGWWQGYQGLVGGDVWTRDANRAIRFYSKLDAERAIGVLGLPAASVFASEVRAAALPAVPEDTEWREAFVEVSASRYRDAGMKIEAARIHAEVDANQLEIIWRAKKAATPAHDQPEGSDNG